MQTAVEWLMNNLIERDLVKTETYIKSFLDASLSQAKEMEKQQIIDAHLIGLIRSLEMEATKQATEYYNETYGK